MRKFLSILGLVVILFVSSNAISGDEGQKINDIYAIIFILDGLNYNTFTRAVSNGELPNIKRYFIDDGANFTNALTIFPTASTSAYQSFISGLFPGNAGLVYLEWFDRIKQGPVNYLSASGYKRINYDLLNLKALLDPNEDSLHPPSTIFDHLKGYETAAIYSSFNGAAKYNKPDIPIPALWSVFASQREEMLDYYALKEVNKLFGKPVNEIPRFTLVGLYSCDALGHHFGADSEILIYNLERFDKFIGEFVESLKEKGIFDKTYIVVAADHGMHNTPKAEFNLDEFAKKIGLSLYPKHPKRTDYDTFISSRGVASAHIYIKGASGWLEKPDYAMIRNYPLDNGKNIDIIKALVEAEELKFVVVKEGFNKTHVFSKNGQGIITSFRRNSKDWYNYRVEGKDDPLELGKSPAAPLIGKGFYSGDVWGLKTYKHKYPDAVVQFSQIFADGRAGDIYVIAEDDWVFFRGKAATHGSIIEADMHVPFMFRGPDVPRGQFTFARVADLYPTLLDWFGISGNPKHYDGQHLFGGHHNYSMHETKSATRPPDDLESVTVLRKLKKLYSDLMNQKNEPRLYRFTPNIALDTNIWLINEHIKRITLEQNRGQAHTSESSSANKHKK